MSLALAGLKELPSSSYGVIVSVAEKPGHHSHAVLVELARVLQPGGTLMLQEAVAVRAPHSAEEQVNIQAGSNPLS